MSYQNRRQYFWPIIKLIWGSRENLFTVKLVTGCPAKSEALEEKEIAALRASVLALNIRIQERDINGIWQIKSWPAKKQRYFSIGVVYIRSLLEWCGHGRWGKRKLSQEMIWFSCRYNKNDWGNIEKDSIPMIPLIYCIWKQIGELFFRD